MEVRHPDSVVTSQQPPVATTPLLMLDAAMNGEPLRRMITITNPQGLHMRPITQFVELATQFKSDVFVIKDPGKKIDGKSAFGLLEMVAEQGCQLELEVNGPDAEEAIAALANVLARSAPEE